MTSSAAVVRHDPLLLDPVEVALTELARGHAVVVVDSEDRENEGDLVFAASLATAELMAFTIRHSSGVVCVPMLGEDLDRLSIDLMSPHNRDPLRTAYTVSVDARHGVSTGISAADRTQTVQLLANGQTHAEDLTQPGHIFPLRYAEGGVLVRPGHTEAAVDLMRLAGLPPVGVISELVHDDGTMQRGPQLRAFADEHQLVLISIEDLMRYRRRLENHQQRVVTTTVPTAHGRFTVLGYRSTVEEAEHVALVYGDIGGGAPVLTRVHSECLTGDVFGSRRCDCGAQLDEAMARVVAAGRGVVIYLRGHEGRGIGLIAKLQAYALQDNGRDTVDANLDLGLPVDARQYVAAAHILRDLGVTSVALLTNNPAKAAQLTDYGIEVTSQLPLTTTPQPDNIAYLTTKRDRMGHQLEQLAGATRSPVPAQPRGDL